ncbi:hypothetical protein ABZ345_01595 [Lentzea sp. NPDC005914]|uniref:hypothetical protein n=1 Tax=Lentzea sp. NPDC005914 TaxID=3154572 RepID=UPI0033F3814B
MTAELVPLRVGFDVAWLGYRRDQVRFFVDAVERDVELLAADRDAAEARALSLARNLEAARKENDELRDRLERMCRRPLSPDSVGEQLRHAVDSALAHAASIAERAGATHAEHRELLTTTRAQMTRLARDGEARRRTLDEAADRRRARAAEDFELALALRRKETLRDIHVMEQTARERAARMVGDAARQVEVLHEHRDHVADVLRTVHALLGKAAEHLCTGDGR